MTDITQATPGPLASCGTNSEELLSLESPVYPAAAALSPPHLGPGPFPVWLSLSVTSVSWEHFPSNPWPGVTLQNPQTNTAIYSVLGAGGMLTSRTRYGA